ncbi:DsbE family thiol:disulfide interchange protein [Marinomonas sp. 15G1-11]|uniref:DsbE family thiol:disulfide interchange protein n=1 Tax=Marinomonas phaeophyticola TaxID=3004091 RepID=A0ABT4JY69_9GAMM|nr:DsbE family thiol:disulfide interchange protein [Marinomonas sp. 15G1-11]MCZ2723327.1 DsbE family thiol:disulfide interchange protein [Marinomonas sp. 15G1-11]
MKKLLVFIPLLVFAVLGSIFFMQLGKDTQYMPSALIDKPLPSVSLVDLHTNGIVTNDGLPSGPYLINFWGTWCPACSIEHNYLMALSEQGVPIVGIDYKDETSEAIKWLQERGDPYSHVLLDELGNFGVNMGVTGAPETFVVNSSGVVVYRHQGVVDDVVWETMKGYFK